MSSASRVVKPNVAARFDQLSRRYVAHDDVAAIHSSVRGIPRFGRLRRGWTRRKDSGQRHDRERQARSRTHCHSIPGVIPQSAGKKIGHMICSRQSCETQLPWQPNCGKITRKGKSDQPCLGAAFSPPAPSPGSSWPFHPPGSPTTRARYR
jgi:hypothetical protein